MLYTQPGKWWLAKDEDEEARIPKITQYPLCDDLSNSEDISTQTARCQVAINCRTDEGIYSGIIVVLPMARRTGERLGYLERLSVVRLNNSKIWINALGN